MQNGRFIFIKFKISLFTFENYFKVIINLKCTKDAKNFLKNKCCIAQCKNNKKKLTYFLSGRRWPNAMETVEPAVWNRDDDAPRCCYYCCCYACAPCWRCCPWESLARFYPPER